MQVFKGCSLKCFENFQQINFSINPTAATDESLSVMLLQIGLIGFVVSRSELHQARLCVPALH